MTPFLNGVTCTSLEPMGSGSAQVGTISSRPSPFGSGVSSRSGAHVRSPVAEHASVFKHVGDGFGFFGWRAVQEFELLHVVEVGVVG